MVMRVARAAGEHRGHQVQGGDEAHAGWRLLGLAEDGGEDSAGCLGRERADLHWMDIELGRNEFRNEASRPAPHGKDSNRLCRECAPCPGARACK